MLHIANLKNVKEKTYIKNFILIVKIYISLHTKLFIFHIHKNILL